MRPRTGARSAASGGTPVEHDVKRWRMLDVHEKPAFLEAELPWIICGEHGKITAMVPWRGTTTGSPGPLLNSRSSAATPKVAMCSRRMAASSAGMGTRGSSWRESALRRESFTRSL